MKNGREKEETKEAHYNFACVLSCGDPEIKISLTRELDAPFGPKGYFWLPELGGVKDFLSPDAPSDKDRLIRKIKKAHSIHPFGLIILINHSNCGAYKLSGHSFDDTQKEEQFHTEELKRAAEVIKKEFPGMVVEIWYFLKAEQKVAWKRMLPNL